MIQHIKTGSAHIRAAELCVVLDLKLIKVDIGHVSWKVSLFTSHMTCDIFAV